MEDIKDIAVSEEIEVNLDDLEIEEEELSEDEFDDLVYKVVEVVEDAVTEVFENHEKSIGMVQSIDAMSQVLSVTMARFLVEVIAELDLSKEDADKYIEDLLETKKLTAKYSMRH